MRSKCAIGLISHDLASFLVNFQVIPHEMILSSTGSESAVTWQNVYCLMGEVRAMAQGLLRCEQNADSLQPTALLLSAFRRQKLAAQDWSEVSWVNREQFLAAMYRAMDRALKDHGRRRNTKKMKSRKMVPIEDLSQEELLRTADFQLHDLEHTLADYPEIIDALTAALAALDYKHPKCAQVAKHRYYGGLTVDQIARVMDISERTVRRYWEKARILLHDEIRRALDKPVCTNRCVR